MHRLLTITPRRNGELGAKVERAGSAGTVQNHKVLSHKYEEDKEYHHVAYHTLLCHFMLFRQGDYSNLEYKQLFKAQIEVLEAYNGGGSI